MRKIPRADEFSVERMIANISGLRKYISESAQVLNDGMRRGFVQKKPWQIVRRNHLMWWLNFQRQFESGLDNFSETSQIE